MASSKNLKATITIGGAMAGSLKSAIGGTRDGLNSIGKAVSDLKSRQKMLGNSIQTFGAMGKNVDGLRAKYAAVTAELGKTLRAQERLNKTTKAMNTAKSTMGAAGMAIGGAVAVAATAGIPIMQAAAFEKAMLGVAKQVDGARDKSGKLTQVYFDMAKQVQLLGRELPMATNDIADMVASGARMGVVKNELIGFTRTAGMMASAFDLPAADLAEQMGKISGIFKIPIPAIGELADVINYLDDNAISQGGDIIEVMKRIGGTAAFVKMPAKEAAALGSTFLTLGSSAEIAATASNAAMRELSIATMQPKRFMKGLAAIGMDAGKIQQDMAKDATGTILKVLDAMNKIPDEKRLTVATQLFGKEYGDDIAKLATGVGEYRRQLGLAGSEAAKGSMSREHQARMQTTTAQWALFKNRVTEVGVNLGSMFLPAANKAMVVIGSVVTKVADFCRENKTLVTNIVTVVGTLAGLYTGVKMVTLGISAVKFAFMALKFAMATNPIGLALALLTTAAVLIWQNWTPIKAFFIDLWGAISAAGIKVWGVLKGLFFEYHPLGIIMENWEPIKGFFVGLFDDIKSTVQGALEWILGKIRLVGEYWGKAKSLFGFGPEAGATAPKPPTVQGSAGPMRASAQQQNVFHITQLPGQDGSAFANEVIRKLDERDATRRRGSMFDPAMGY